LHVRQKRVRDGFSVCGTVWRSKAALLHFGTSLSRRPRTSLALQNSQPYVVMHVTTLDRATPDSIPRYPPKLSHTPQNLRSSDAIDIAVGGMGKLVCPCRGCDSSRASSRLPMPPACSTQWRRIATFFGMHPPQNLRSSDAIDIARRRGYCVARWTKEHCPCRLRVGPTTF